MSTQDERDLLKTVGTDVLRTFVAITVETWAVVIYTALVVKAAFILRSRSGQRKGVLRHAMLIVVLVMWSMNLALWTIDVRNLIVELRITFVENSEDSLDVRYGNSFSKQLPLYLVEDILFSYMTLLGDAIVLWRVWAFWRERRERAVLLFPGAVYLASVTLSGLLTYCAVQSDTDISHGAFTHPAFCTNIQWSSYWAQLGTAIVSTALIAIKTWKYRRLLKKYLDSSEHSSPVYGAMMIIIESGAIYTIYFLAEAVLMFPSLKRASADSFNGSFALLIYQYSTSSIVGIYPTIVVILVHTHCSLVDSQDDTAVSSVNFGADHHDSTRQDELIMTSALDECDSSGKGSEVKVRREVYDEEQGSFGSWKAGRDRDIPRFVDPLDDSE